MGRNSAPQPKTGFSPQQFGMASSANVSQSQAPTRLPRQQFLSPETMSWMPNSLPQTPAAPQYSNGSYEKYQNDYPNWYDDSYK